MDPVTAILILGVGFLLFEKFQTNNAASGGTTKPGTGTHVSPDNISAALDSMLNLVTKIAKNAGGGTGGSPKVGGGGGGGGGPFGGGSSNGDGGQSFGDWLSGGEKNAAQQQDQQTEQGMGSLTGATGGIGTEDASGNLNYSDGSSSSGDLPPLGGDSGNTDTGDAASTDSGNTDTSGGDATATDTSGDSGYTDTGGDSGGDSGGDVMA